VVVGVSIDSEAVAQNFAELESQVKEILPPVIAELEPVIRPEIVEKVNLPTPRGGASLLPSQLE
jgi:hypothetical protein